MDWTGSLYFIDTNKCGKWVLENLKQCFHEKYHYTFQDNSDEEWDYLLFYRDKKMLNHHLEKGYNDDMDGKGCFGIEAKNVDLKAIATITEYEGKPVDVLADTVLFFENIYHITLVLPGDIEDTPFSKNIYDDVLAVLRG